MGNRLESFPPVPGRYILQGHKWFDFFKLFRADAFDVEKLVDGAEFAAELGSFGDDGVSGFAADARDLSELSGGGGIEVDDLTGLLGG